MVISKKYVFRRYVVYPVSCYFTTFMSTLSSQTLFKISLDILSYHNIIRPSFLSLHKTTGKLHEIFGSHRGDNQVSVSTDVTPYTLVSNYILTEHNF